MSEEHEAEKKTSVAVVQRPQLQPDSIRQPVCAVSPTVAYKIHPSQNQLTTNSSIPPSSKNLWLSDVGAFQKPLPNIEGAKSIGPRILGSFPGLYNRGSGGKRNKIIRHATFSDSFLHSRNGLLGEIKNRGSTLGEMRNTISAGVADSNTSTSDSNQGPRRIRFHSVDGSHFLSSHPVSKLQNIMKIQNQESKLNTNWQRTNNFDSSSNFDDKNDTKSNEIFENLKERAKRLKRIIEEDKNNNNNEETLNQKQEVRKSSLGHKNYCNDRKTNQVVQWLTEVNKEMYDVLNS